eukprot:526936_1
MNQSVLFIIAFVLIWSDDAKRPSNYQKPTKPKSSKCKITDDIINELRSTVSSWYFQQLDGAKHDYSVSEFNPIIDEVFSCDSDVDVCIGSNVNDNTCSIDSYHSCNELKDPKNGYWAQNWITAIIFGQIGYKCDSHGHIIARLTKSFVLEDGTAENNDDTWIFEFV